MSINSRPFSTRTTQRQTSSGELIAILAKSARDQSDAPYRQVRYQVGVAKNVIEISYQCDSEWDEHALI